MDKLKKKDIGREWGKVPTIARYADLSPRTIRSLIKSGEIRHSRLSTGTVLIKMDWIDDYLEHREVRESQVDRIVGSILAILKNRND
jgi:excisionase family DNA binding protein